MGEFDQKWLDENGEKHWEELKNEKKVHHNMGVLNRHSSTSEISKERLQ